MAFEPPITVLDACILYPFHLRNVIVQLAVDRLLDVRWTAAIHDEWIRNLLIARPEIPAERLEATRRLLYAVLPDAMTTVADYWEHLNSTDLPEPDDRHVVAAAIAAGAAVILTWSLRDFPSIELARFGLRAVDPDSFLVELHEQAPQLVVASLANARSNLRRSQTTSTGLIAVLRQQRLFRLADRMAHHLEQL